MDATVIKTEALLNNDEHVRLAGLLKAYHLDKTVFTESDLMNVLFLMIKVKYMQLDEARLICMDIKKPLAYELFSSLLFNVLIKGEKIGGKLLVQYIKEIAEFVPQKNEADIANKYGCILSKIILKSIEILNKNQEYKYDVMVLLNFLDPDKLSQNEISIHNSAGGEIKMASHAEEYYSLKSKALLSLHHYEECLTVCDNALKKLKEFHYKNDLWFSYRMFKCYEAKHMLKEAEKELTTLIKKQTGAETWFFYADLSMLMLANGNNEEAVKYALSALYYLHDFKFGFHYFYHWAKLFFKQDPASEIPKWFAFQILKISSENEWRLNENENKLVTFYKDEISKLKDQHIEKTIKKLVKQLLIKNVEEEIGYIFMIHKNKKSGKLRSPEDMIQLSFKKREVLNCNIEELKYNDCCKFYRICLNNQDYFAINIRKIKEEKE